MKSLLMVALGLCFAAFFSPETVTLEEKNMASCINLLDNGTITSNNSWNLDGQGTLSLLNQATGNQGFRLWNTSGGTSGYTQSLAISATAIGKDCYVSGWVKEIRIVKSGWENLSSGSIFLIIAV
ncbi:MAG: hypothetical protein AAGJ93_08950 [Bacteroidota bacterium]